jgi:hypothetical protein
LVGTLAAICCAMMTAALDWASDRFLLHVSTSMATLATVSARLLEPTIQIRVVDSLQRHQASGKLRRFIPLWAAKLRRAS